MEACDQGASMQVSAASPPCGRLDHFLATQRTRERAKKGGEHGRCGASKEYWTATWAFASARIRSGNATCDVHGVAATSDRQFLSDRREALRRHRHRSCHEQHSAGLGDAHHRAGQLERNKKQNLTAVSDQGRCNKRRLNSRAGGAETRGKSCAARTGIGYSSFTQHPPSIGSERRYVRRHAHPTGWSGPAHQKREGSNHAPPLYKVLMGLELAVQSALGRRPEQSGTVVVGAGVVPRCEIASASD